MYESRFTPPSRSSLTDAQLQDALTLAQADEAGILAAMALLEEQAALREIEKLEFASWEAELLASGDPQALFAINNERAKRGLELLETRSSQPAAPETIESPLLIEDVVANLALQEMSAPVSANSTTPVIGSEEEQFTVEQEAPATNANRIVADITDSVAIQDVEQGVQQQPEIAPMASPRTNTQNAAQATATNEAAQKTNEVAEKKSSANKLRRERLDPRSLASSQFWSWAAIGGSALPMGLAILLAQANLSFGQGVLALALGFAATGAVISVGALAGKRSGLGTLMLSRAAFGVNGNILPAILLAISRLIGIVAIFMLVPILLTSSATDEPMNLSFENPQFIVAVVALVVVAVFASVVAIRGGALLHTVQKWGAILGFAAVTLMLILLFPSIQIEKLAAGEGGGWLATLGAATLIFAISGLLWSGAGADYARRLSVDQLGIKVVSWVFLVVAIVPFIIATFGFAFFESISDQSKLRFAQNFTSAIAESGPLVLIPTMLSIAVAVLVASAMALYSASHALKTLSIQIKPVILHPVLAVIAITVAVGAAGRLANSDLWFNLGGYLLVLAVPAAAWSGIFACDILIRRIAYHEVSLSRSYGFYKPVNWINVTGWLVITAIGWGLSVSNLTEFAWLGYLVSDSSAGFWQQSNFAVVVAFAAGLLMPALLGVPRIKKQEAEVLSLEARRNDLRDIFGLAD